ncbi:TRAP transporter large permease [Pararhodobacter zhoushanensis]|uniref:TRAP transporter large permease protein n=1 Tax=Pararhodobacter zhoushanensis TaxID=2479545 RepID=A0ABT3GU40_9RHOB|nr:TRAP transporter large permease [Pararhodobacter zhoushanensis]MCW1931052.1 TRAP transporter large permease [Pararhodobacter zhoushanensis]
MMDPSTVALIGFVAMFGLIALHVPIGIAMTVVGVVGFASMAGWNGALTLLATEPASTMASLDLAVIPLFMLMGSLAAAGGLAKDIFTTAEALVGHRPGGLAATTIVASAGFGAVCGSAVAATATFGRVALPEMLSRGYSGGNSAGVVAAGGTLGIIVPPSSIMVLYAVLTEQSVLTMFSAAIIPALLSVALYLAAIWLVARRNPASMPGSEKLPVATRIMAIGGSWGAILLAIIVLGGIYSGVFTVNEAAAIGVVFAFFFALGRGKLNRQTFVEVLSDAASATVMIYIIVFGAMIFSYFVSLSGVSEEIIGGIQALGLPNAGVIFLLILIYLFLGAFFDEVAAVVVTLPFVLPIILAMGYDPIWWGILNVALIGVGMLTPPIGINVMLLNAMRSDISLYAIYRGVFAFFLADCVRIFILAVFPQVTLWLPSIL